MKNGIANAVLPPGIQIGPRGREGEGEGRKAMKKVERESLGKDLIPGFLEKLDQSLKLKTKAEALSKGWFLCCGCPLHPALMPRDCRLGEFGCRRRVSEDL